MALSKHHQTNTFWKQPETFQIIGKNYSTTTRCWKN